MKFTTAFDALKLVKSGDNIFHQGSSATPITLLNALAEHAPRLKGVNIYSAFAISPTVAKYAHESVADSFNVKSFFVCPAVRDNVNNLSGDYIPSMLGDIPNFFRSKLITLDVAIINVSPPNEKGFCSMGSSVDISASAVEMATIVIAQINQQQPFTFGDSVVHSSKFAAAVLVDEPLSEVPYAVPTKLDIAIARNVADYIHDGATLQVGVGALPNAVLSALKDRKHLGIHTEAITEGMLELINCGAVDNSLKTIHPGITLATLSVGSRKLYDYMHNNQDVLMKDVAYTNDPFKIAQNPNVVAINSAIEVDISGQVVADSIGGRVYSGVGGQHDFMYGGNLCPTGKTFIAMSASTNKGASKIVHTLTPAGGVVTPRAMMQYVATEHGVAELRGKTLVERARALILIADPAAREELERVARERYGKSWK